MLIKSSIYCLLLEPVRFIAGKEEYEYNLDALTMIEATDSFISQDEDVRGCQLEPLFNCTTRKYLKALLDRCGCLPLSINKRNVSYKGGGYQNVKLYTAQEVN